MRACASCGRHRRVEGTDKVMARYGAPFIPDSGDANDTGATSDIDHHTTRAPEEGEVG